MTSCASWNVLRVNRAGIICSSSCSASVALGPVGGSPSPAGERRRPSALGGPGPRSRESLKRHLLLLRQIRILKIPMVLESGSSQQVIGCQPMRNRGVVRHPVPLPAVNLGSPSADRWGGLMREKTVRLHPGGCAPRARRLCAPSLQPRQRLPALTSHSFRLLGAAGWMPRNSRGGDAALPSQGEAGL